MSGHAQLCGGKAEARSDKSGQCDVASGAISFYLQARVTGRAALFSSCSAFIELLSRTVQTETLISTISLNNGGDELEGFMFILLD